MITTPLTKVSRYVVVVVTNRNIECQKFVRRVIWLAKSPAYQSACNQ